MLGKKVAIWGKAVRIANASTSIRKKGNIPRKITSMGISLATPVMAYTLMPTGGVMTAVEYRHHEV
jgi:hypothetical protein